MHNFGTMVSKRAPGLASGGWSRHRTGQAILGATILVVAMIPGGAIGANGNIGSNAIEVADDANLYPEPSTGCDGNTLDPAPDADAFDWVKDCLANTDPDLTVGTNVAVKKGHWNGFRVTDGIAGGDEDIFLTGGKENKLDTWNPGPGTVGSSKYDITQAYIANNSTDVFFGMERRGNNGTTAFDWEFNRLAPNASNPDYIPTRAECDVLVTFEMQGSGKSGTALPYLFRYDDPDVANTGSGNPKTLNCSTSVNPVGYAGDTDLDGKYVSQSVAGVVAVINNDPIPSAPWGTVSSGGTWTTAAIDNFQFAEAKVPLTLLGISPGDTCTAISRYLQVRTRSSSTDTSDLKDLTKIQSFDFFAPTNPTQTVTTNCSAQFHFASSLNTGTTPTWTFTVPLDSNDQSPVTLTGTGSTSLTEPTIDTTNDVKKWTAQAFSGDVQVGGFPSGADSVVINVSQGVSDANNCNTSSTGTVTVYKTQTGLASASSDCDGNITYSASVSGGKAPYDLTVELQQQQSDGTWTTRHTDTYTADADGSVTNSATPYDGSAYPGTWRVHVTSTDSQTVGPNGGGCVITFNSSTFQVRAPLTATAAKDASTTVASTTDGSLTAGLDGGHAGALAGDTLAYQWQISTDGGTTWNPLSGKTTEDITYTGFKTDDTTPTAVNFSIGSGGAQGTYKGIYWAVDLRLHVTRTVGTLQCSADSSPVTVKILEGVDP